MTYSNKSTSTKLGAIGKNISYGLLLWWLLIPSSFATPRWQVIILPDSSKQVPIELREFSSIVAQGLSTALSSANVEVHDQHYLGLPDCTMADCSSLTDGQLQQRARASDKILDIALLYQLQLRQHLEGSVEQWRFNLSGRLLDLTRGTQQESFALGRRDFTAIKSCRGPCLREWLKNISRILAQELGAILSEKLAALPQLSQYQLQLNNFDSRTLQDFDHYLSSMPGYVTHALLLNQVERQGSSPLASRNYLYSSQLNSADLSLQFADFQRQQGVEMDINYHNEPQHFSLVIKNTPSLLAYFWALALLFLLVLLWSLRSWQSYHQHALDKLAKEAKIEQWLHYLANITAWSVLFKRHWRRQQVQYLTDIEQAKGYLNDAKLAMDRQDYALAQHHINAAQGLNSESAEARNLALLLLRYQRAAELVELAQTSGTTAKQALAFLREARGFNPQLASGIALLEQGYRAELSAEEALNEQAKCSSYTPDVEFTAYQATTENAQYLKAQSSKSLIMLIPVWMTFLLLLVGVFYWYALPITTLEPVELGVDESEPLLAEALANIEEMFLIEQDEVSAWHRALNLDTSDSYQHYLISWPHGIYATYALQSINSKSEDAAAWQQANSMDTKPSYQLYLDVKPLGQFTELALQKIATIEQHQQLEDLFAQGEQYAQNNDFTNAFFYYQQAAQGGLANAQYQLGQLHYLGQGSVKDIKQAAQWYKQAAEQGQANAQARLGYLYSKGRGVAQDGQQAVHWYRQAAKQGITSAQYNLGYLYEEGQSIKRDYQQAAYWFRLAADHGDPDAQYQLGMLYEKGQGVVKDLDQAKSYLRQAAAQGHQLADVYLRLLMR